MFASVATRIPIFPANAEKIAPIKKAGTIIQLVDGTSVEIIKSNTPAMTANMANSLYSALKNASAPSLILFEIDCIRSLPAGCFFTQLILTSIKRRPKMANTIGT